MFELLVPAEKSQLDLVKGDDRIQVDIMDGHFVPNNSMGATIVQSLRRVTDLQVEIHMMISDPDFFLSEFVEAGSDSFLVHWEGDNNLHRTAQRIKALGKVWPSTQQPRQLCWKRSCRMWTRSW